MELSEKQLALLTLSPRQLASLAGPNTASRIYFLQVDDAGPIKIGVTDGPLRRRISDLQVGCPWPLRPLGELIGHPRLETVLHEHLSRYRISGEWFAPDPVVLETVSAVLEGRFEWPEPAVRVGMTFGIRAASIPDLIQIEVPANLSPAVRRAAAVAKVSPQALVIDVLRDIFESIEPGSPA